MAVPGYFLGDTWEQPAFLRDCESYGQDIIAASTGITVMFGNVAVDWQKKNNDGRVRKYNAFFIAQDGKLVQPDNMPYPYTIKTLMPNYREFDDTRHFFSLQKLARELGTTPQKLLSPVSLKIRGRRFEVGCLLCEDGWSDDYELAPLKILEEDAIDFYVNISASPYTLGKNDKRNRVFGRQAKDAGVPLFYVNCIGLQEQRQDRLHLRRLEHGIFGQRRRRLHGAGKPAAMTSGSCRLMVSADVPAAPVPEEPDIAHIPPRCITASPFPPEHPHEETRHRHLGGIDSAVATISTRRVVGPENLPVIQHAERLQFRDDERPVAAARGEPRLPVHDRARVRNPSTTHSAV